MGLLLAAATFLAYQPIWHAGFIWDDDIYVTANRLLTAPDGLSRIWFSLDSPSQYFPLTYTSLRFERGLWGLSPAGYHGVNLLLHAVNALLLWRLLKRLGLTGAWLAAAIFALHPVQVESVAWIAELKNVLMLFFYLLAVWAWVEFIERPAGRGGWYYLLALLLHALALCAKTTACTLPVALLLILWLKAKPIGRVRLAQTLPFFALSLGMGLLTIWWERYHQGTQGTLFEMPWLERVLVASHAFWFYLGKLVWPANLIFIYPRWPTDDAVSAARYLWLAAAAGLGVAIYFTRRFHGRGVESALIFFVVTLSPVLGFIMLYTFSYTFVADHYQYVACIGPMALGSAGLSLALGSLERRLAWAKMIVPMALLLTLGALTWRQCGMYANAETLWRTTIARNPDCWMAHDNLGVELGEQGKLAEAMQHFELALQLKPDYADAYCNLGVVLARQGKLVEAIQHYERALQLKPNYAEAHNGLGNALAGQGRWDEAIPHYERALQLKPDNAVAHYNLGCAALLKGAVDAAIAQFQKALQINPDYAEARNNLAWLLATCPQASLRNGNQAVALAQRANQLTGDGNPVVLCTLAAAYAEAGRFPEAVETAQRALQLAGTQSNPALADALRSQLKLYQAGIPFHSAEPTP
ncbi:MAG: tetratricopeptide repeat protein [Verrucomicrobiota bacterium]